MTITGAAGYGKTRLAVEVALQLVPEFADGVWFVDLSVASEDSEIPAAIAVPVGAARSPSSTQTALEAVIQPRQALLILDNCEHLVDVCARSADALLKR